MADQIDQLAALLDRLTRVGWQKRQAGNMMPPGPSSWDEFDLLMAAARRGVGIRGTWFGYPVEPSDAAVEAAMAEAREHPGKLLTFLTMRKLITAAYRAEREVNDE